MCLLLVKRRRAQQKTPCAFCSGVVSAWCRLLRKSDVWPVDPVDLLKKEPLKGNSEVHLHSASKFGEDPSKDLGGVGEQTNKQTDRQTNAARIIVWFTIYIKCAVSRQKISHHNFDSNIYMQGSVTTRIFQSCRARYTSIKNERYDKIR